MLCRLLTGMRSRVALKNYHSVTAGYSQCCFPGGVKYILVSSSLLCLPKNLGLQSSGEGLLPSWVSGLLAALQIRLKPAGCTARATVKVGVWTITAMESCVILNFRDSLAKVAYVSFLLAHSKNVICIDFYQFLFVSSNQPTSPYIPSVTVSVGSKDFMFCFFFSPF